MTRITSELFSDQQTLWDNQHTQRGGHNGLEGEHLVDTPNDTAIFLNGLLEPESTIAEVGSANGRDARFWAKHGHRVHCMDFSRVALGQLIELSERQGVADRINPIHFDATTGKLPEQVGTIDAFYARSALHVDDDTLMSLLDDVNSRLGTNGVVVIEGKSTDDPKIARSVNLGNGLAVDPNEHGHVRRIWTSESLKGICRTFGWTALQEEVIGEQWIDTQANFVRLVAAK